MVEVIVAILVLATATFGVMSVLLSARKTQSNSDRKQVATFYSQLLRETLKNYVVAYGAAGNPAAGDLTALGMAMQGTWFCPAATYPSGCPTLPNDNATCLWALDAGAACNADTGHVGHPGHVADALLPSWFTAAPFNGHMFYFVGSDGGSGKAVTINVVWTEPST